MSDDARFPQTRWTLVESAGEETQSARPALEQLLQRYLPALRAHLLYRRQVKADAADDLLHSFIARRVLEMHLIGKADRTRGKFRTFLLTALDRFVSNELRSQRTIRRGGGNVRSLENEALIEPADRGERPSDAFDVQWARGIIGEAVSRMKAACQQHDRPELWRLFELRVLGPALEARPAPSYASLVRQFGFETPAQASNAMVTAKRIFARALRDVVGEYTDDREQTDAEIMDLYDVLSRSRGFPADSQDACKP
jgi:RNA polymerase sigma-70 factor (ECF subfamily)